MYEILFVVVFALVGIYAELRSLERQRINYDLDNRYSVLYHDLRSMPKYENLTDDEIKTRCFYLRYGSPDAVPLKGKRLQSFVLVLLILSLIAGVIFCAVDFYHYGYRASLEEFSPAAYNAGNDTAEEMRDFYADRTNFCAVCDRCRYSEDDGSELDGSLENLDGIIVWICDWCLSRDSFYVCVDGKVYSFQPAS